MHKSSGHLYVLDLFSGIGGFSYALKGITQTKIYCDIDEDCLHVLQKHFKNSIFLKNVKDIDQKMISDIPCLKKVEMICAGFPCVDISVANHKGEGIKGKYSGLFSEIIRIIDLLPNIKVLFLENSPQIKLKGLNSILLQLKKRHFSCVWTYINASDVGALHKRKRWYCLCVKTNEENNYIMNKLKPVSYQENIENIDWKEDKNVPRVINTTYLSKQEKKSMLKRCAMLGNSIVPQCAAYAWNKLIEEIHYLSKIQQKNHFKLKLFFHQIDIEPLKQNTLNLVFSDGNNGFTKNRWATPVRSIWHMFSAISCKRSETTLVVQILFEKNTQVKRDKDGRLKYKNYIVNPRFIEHLMGYPKDWTL